MGIPWGQGGIGKEFVVHLAANSDEERLRNSPVVKHHPIAHAGQR